MTTIGTSFDQATSLDSLADVLRGLDPIMLAVWCALELSAREGTVVTANRELTQALLAELEATGAIVLLQRPAAGASSLTAESVSWAYRSPCLPADGLPPILFNLLTSVDRTRYSARIRQLWSTLADSESESYLAYQLRSHHMNPYDASWIIAVLGNDWHGHTLGRRRYLTWFGIRGAASTLLRSNIDRSMARSSLVVEIRKRGRWLSSRSSTVADEDQSTYCFVPDTRWRRPTLLSVALSTILPIGNRYWTDHPEVGLLS